MRAPLLDALEPLDLGSTLGKGFAAQINPDNSHHSYFVFRQSTMVAANPRDRRRVLDDADVGQGARSRHYGPCTPLPFPYDRTCSMPRSAPARTTLHTDGMSGGFEWMQIQISGSGIEIAWHLRPRVSTRVAPSDATAPGWSWGGRRRRWAGRSRYGASTAPRRRSIPFAAVVEPDRGRCWSRVPRDVREVEPLTETRIIATTR